jgi:3-phosphoshikimate 1-carboxyvinyltransferase
MNEYPSQLEIVPVSHPPHKAIEVPGSKSITNRAFILAALCSQSHEHCTLSGWLNSEDTGVMLECLESLGYPTNLSKDRVGFNRNYTDRLVPNEAADLFVGNSGTTMRFLTAMLALGRGRYRLDGVPRMRERPIQDLLDALGQLGVKAFSEMGNGCPPVIIEAGGLRGGHVKIRGSVSSQFLSGLLMASPFAESDVHIEVDGPLVSVPYVDMTLAMMRQFNLQVEHDNRRLFRIPGRQRGGIDIYRIEPDASAASYFYAAAAITGGKIVVPFLGTRSLQGDVRFVDLLEQMGCRVQRWPEVIDVTGGTLHGIDADMNDISDTAMTLAAVACFASGPTTIRNVAHIRHKETDRLAALATELRRLGAIVDERGDGLTITPAPLRGAVVQTYNDHRMAMSLALIGLKVPGVVIDNPSCVAKTYPNFFDDFSRAFGDSA